jgi:hypothetical protein
VDRTVDPQVLSVALGQHQPGLLPTPVELAALIADVEVDAIRAEFAVSEELLGTAWYLHGVAAAATDTELYDPVRRQHAFAVSAHVMDLALSDPRNQPDIAADQPRLDAPAGLDIAADQSSAHPCNAYEGKKPYLTCCFWGHGSVDVFPIFQQVEASEQPVLPPGTELTCGFRLV